MTHYAVVAIPLGRSDVVDFLRPPQPEAEGAVVRIVDQRPHPAREAEWLDALLHDPTPANLVAIDSPHNYLIDVHTDRLVPVHFLLEEDDYLVRNLGGWAAIYFGVMELSDDLPDDPLLAELETLTDYGDAIDYLGADAALVAERLPVEMGMEHPSEVADAFERLIALRDQMTDSTLSLQRTAYIERLYRELEEGTLFESMGGIPETILFDELMHQMVRLEQSRRRAIAQQSHAEAAAIDAWQRVQQMNLILKGEYIVGRHRRSTILIAPRLGVVVKQPAPEPQHEIELRQRTYDGKDENWPIMKDDERLVTPRGRIRLVVEENIIPRLAKIFDHQTHFSTLLGLSVEPYIAGKTLQELVWEDPDYFSDALWNYIVLHQRVCEHLGAHNGDWHSANFVRRKADDRMIHIDWGAVRLIEDESPDARERRLREVKNIAYSFHDEELAARFEAAFEDLVADEERLAVIDARAQQLIEERLS